MTIPIVISFNDNFTIPAGVCISSLLANADLQTMYKINILYSNSRLSNINREKFKQLVNQKNNASIEFIDVNEAFEGAYEVRGVTLESYYRLLIPNIFSDFEKLIYIDVDTIINTDLSNLYNTNIDNVSIAGVPEFYSKLCPIQSRYLKRLQLQPELYINAGILLFNLKKIRATINSYNKKVNELSKKKLLYQDQDILNILFKNDIEFIEHHYNYSYAKLKDGLSIAEPAIIHYTLEKPWNTPRPFGDIWWNYYKKSILYDDSYYLTYQTNAYDKISFHLKVGRLMEKFGFHKLISLKNHILLYSKNRL